MFIKIYENAHPRLCTKDYELKYVMFMKDLCTQYYERIYVVFMKEHVHHVFPRHHYDMMMLMTSTGFHVISMFHE